MISLVKGTVGPSLLPCATLRPIVENWSVENLLDELAGEAHTFEKTNK